MPTTFFVAVAVLSGAPEFTAVNYREIDGGQYILYRASCLRRSGQASLCTLRKAVVNTDTTPVKCGVSFDTVFEDQPAQNPEKGTFTVSVSGGLCGYTNTYVMSPSGLVHTKTSPAKARPSCEVFSPKTYRASVFESDELLFAHVPIGGCKTMSFHLGPLPAE